MCRFFRDVENSFSARIGDAPERPSYRRLPLLNEEVVYVRAGSEDSAPGPISFTSILDLPLALPNERDVIRVRMQTIADQMKLSMQIGYEVSSIAMLKGLVADGGVATVMPFASVRDEFGKGILHICRIIEPVPVRRLYLLHRWGTLTKKPLAFALLSAVFRSCQERESEGDRGASHRV